MADITLQYVNSYYDRHGGRRHTFRRKGHKRVSLPGLPGSAEFMDAYQAMLDKTGGSAMLAEIGASRTKAGTIDALVVAYYKHDDFKKGLAPATQNMRRPIIDRFRELHTPRGRRYGENSVATLQRKNIMAALEGKTRNAQKNWLKAIRGLMVFAISQNMRADDPSEGLKAVKGPKSSGHKTWLEPQVVQYREHHKIGTVARLALELLLNIAARRHDAHVIGRQHIDNGKLCWRPHKTLRTTGKMLKVRIIPQLQAALDAMPQLENVLTFLVNDYGRPFASAAAFGNKFADWCKAAGLKPVLCDDGKVRNYRAHGLRKASLRALAHAGCTGSELMAVGGHSSLAQLQVYLDEVEQERQADVAMDKLMASEAKTATSSD
jgi:site-specific recombinase XerD